MKKTITRLLLVFGTIAILSSITPGCKSKPKDASIKTSVEKALQADPQTTGVRVNVTEGVATLTGEVSNAAAQSAAGTIAGGVKGVKSVQNNVTIASAPVEITPDDPLSSAVKDGVITVTGELKAADWKRLKMALDGLKPKKVDAAALKISN